MESPRTIYEVLQELRDYHNRRLADYKRQSMEMTDPDKKILLEHLICLEEHSQKSIQEDLDQITPEQSTYLATASPLPGHRGLADLCRCDDNSTFDDTLACALASGKVRREVLDAIERSSAASSVVQLAKRLRELEEIQGRQIANFTRTD